ncbi:hypothetical protein AJ87_03110 [Rhizobium yanglingense]|nr:hypothetical protein AJ87_03110 [Rhizobium yanglingense]
MSAEVRVYIIGEDDELENDTISPLVHFGEIPQVGDVLHEGIRGANIGFYTVENRYFFQNAPGPGWALIVRKREPTTVDEKLLKAWNDDDEFWAEVDRKEDAKKERELRARLASSSRSRKANGRTEKD